MKNILMCLFILYLFIGCQSNHKITDSISEKDYNFSPTGQEISNSEFIKDIQIHYDKVKNSGIKSLGIIKPIKTREEVAKLFSPENNTQCSLPEQIKNKLKNNTTWTPPDVIAQLKTMPVNATLVENTLVMSYLNTLNIKPKTGDIYQIEVSTANNFDPLNFINLGKSNFSYSLDCAGYLNAALSFNAEASIAEIKTSASSSIKSNGSLGIVRAYVYPPIVEVIRKVQIPEMRLNPMFAFNYLVGFRNALKADASDEDIIVIGKEIDVMWLAGAGNSNFNGKGDLSGNIGAFGIKLSASTGGKISRSSSFNKFQTIVLNSQVSTLPQEMTIKEANEILQSLVHNSTFAENPKRIDNNLVFALNIPSDLGSSSWSLKGVTNAQVNTEKFAIDKVKFTISGLEASNKQLNLITDWNNLELTKNISL